MLGQSGRHLPQHPSHGKAPKPAGTDVLGQARLGVAVTRGLLLDLLATGERAACNAAMEQYIRLGQAYLAEQSSPRSPR
jgi:hypothetical protein